MEPPDQSAAPLSEINQHPSRRFVIEYSRRACYRNVMNFIRSKPGCDPSTMAPPLLNFLHVPVIETPDSFKILLAAAPGNLNEPGTITPSRLHNSVWFSEGSAGVCG